MSPRQKVFVALSFAAGLAALISALPAGEAAESAPPANAPYRNAKLPVDKRVADLLKRMTLAEKVAQLGSANWDKNAVDDPKTHEFSPALGKKLMPDGIGEITRPSDRHDAKGAVAFANAI